MKIVLLAFSALIVFTSQLKAQVIPNSGFENWEMFSYEEPTETWFTSNSFAVDAYRVAIGSRVAGHASTYAVRLEAKRSGTDTIPAFVTNSLGDIESGEGGAPYTGAKPTAITGFLRYNLLNTDSIFVLCMFKKNGVVIGADQFNIRGTGSQSAFTQFSFPVSMTVVPDTILFAMTIGNLFEGSYGTPGSWLELDSVAATTAGGSVLLKDGNFENWDVNAIDNPTNWEQGFVYTYTTPNSVNRSTDKYAGTYAARMVSTFIAAQQEVEGGSITGAGLLPASSASFLDSLTGYYKYSTTGTDQGAAVMIFVDAQGNIAGNPAFFLMDPTTTYKPFSIAIEDRPAGAQGIIIAFTSSSPISGDPVLGSELLVDEVSIKRTPVVSVKDVQKLAFALYPNPAQDMLNITNATGAAYTITSIAGKAIANGTVQANAINISSLVPGNYMLTIQPANGNSQTMKFEKR